MSCYLVTVYQENMIPEIVKICKTYKEAEEAVKEVEVDDCIIGIERGSDEWLEL